MDYTEKVIFTSFWKTDDSEADIQHWIDTVTRPPRSRRKYGGPLSSNPPLIVDFELDDNLCELSVTFPEQLANGVFVQNFEFYHDLAERYDEMDFVYDFITQNFPGTFISEEWSYFETGPLAMPVTGELYEAAAGGFGDLKK